MNVKQQDEDKCNFGFLPLSLFPSSQSFIFPFLGQPLLESPHLGEGMQSRKHKPTPWSAMFEHPPLRLNTIHPPSVLLWLMETFVSGSIPDCWSDQGAGATQPNNMYGQILERRNALSDNLRRCYGTFRLQPPTPCDTVALRKGIFLKDRHIFCLTLKCQNIAISNCTKFSGVHDRQSSFILFNCQSNSL